ncbi:uncharacterized protein LOC6568934 [Drosophila grimshawi]|uniref:GH23833 n=1 Tax=Drosophila grimshawi TaxID=7222 RepID=B4K1F1_DROGR|nr:uncharacterized protein LOC6568934 [Drosophila grimshawi]EDV90373.1 GH23833 [Drosophila grimshawi]
MPLMNLENCVQHSIGLLGASRCMSTFKHCKSAIRVKKVSRITERAVPAYFKQLRPCRTDEELRAHSSLGYQRCNIPHRPECIEPCLNMQRFDAQHYKPSKSLDRDYRANLADCVLEKMPKTCRIERIATETSRRKLAMPRCVRVPTQKCHTQMPIKCRPFTPASATSDERCIKFPRSKCPKA